MRCGLHADRKSDLSILFAMVRKSDSHSDEFDSCMNSIPCRKNCCSFFHSYYVFFLTSMPRDSIHSSTAIHRLQNRCNPSKRENRQMATKKAAKKAAKKAPAKKAAKKAAKKK